MHDDLVTLRKAPEKRATRCEGGVEHHLSEGAVMIAFAMHLLRAGAGVTEIAIHPDGEHGKQFDFEAALGRRGFRKIAGTGRTSYGGTYQSVEGVALTVHPASGLGDVVARCGDGRTFIAECKGGVVNSRHPGPVSRLRRGLCEAVGLSLARAFDDGAQQFAVVPHTRTTEELARRLAVRARAAGIRIALVDAKGKVTEIGDGREERHLDLSGAAQGTV
jgi:hypothetical protein